MPIYEYECEKCHKRTELLQKLSDPPLESCPECKSPVHKIVSPPGLHFKGTGWYVTDYAKKSGEPTATKAPASKEKSEKAASTPKPTSGSTD